MPNRPRWPLAAGLAAGVALDALLGDPRRGHPVAAFGRAAAALEARDYADSRLAARARRRLRPGRGRPRRPHGPPHAGRPPPQAAAAALAVWAVTGGRSLHLHSERIRVALAAHDLRTARRPAEPVRPRSGAAGCGTDRPGGDRVGGREHLGCGGGAPAVGGGGRVARIAGLPRGQHPRRHGRVPLAPLPAVRLGLGPPGRCRQLGPGPGHRRAHDHLRPACPAGPFADGFRPESAGEGTSCARSGRGGAAGRARYGNCHPSPNAGRCEAAFAGALGLRLGGTNVYSGITEARPGLGDGRAPEPDDIRRAIRLSRAVTVSATALAVLLALVRPSGRLTG